MLKGMWRCLHSSLLLKTCFTSEFRPVCWGICPVRFQKSSRTEIRQLWVRILHLFFLNVIMFLLAHSSSLSRSQWTAALSYSILIGPSNFMSSANVMRPLPGNWCKCQRGQALGLAPLVLHLPLTMRTSGRNHCSLGLVIQTSYVHPIVCLSRL